MKGKCPICTYDKWDYHGYADFRTCRKCGSSSTHFQWKEAHQNQIDKNKEYQK